MYTVERYDKQKYGINFPNKYTNLLLYLIINVNESEFSLVTYHFQTKLLSVYVCLIESEVPCQVVY